MWHKIALSSLLLLTMLQITWSSPTNNQREADYAQALKDNRKQVVGRNGNRDRFDENALEAFRDMEETIYNYGVTDDDLIDGDIRRAPNTGGRKKRKVANNYNFRQWPNKQVPWFINPGDFGAEEQFVRERVTAAVAEWEARSCLTFPELSTASPVVRVINGSGCWSYIGQAYSTQSLSIKMNSQTSGCVFHGTIMHEFGHALGFHHEQTRPDREEEAIVHYGNVLAGREHNFYKNADGYYLTYANAPYDPSSVMHYGRSGFSINGLDTISMKRAELTSLMGNRQSASYYDEVALNIAYNCEEDCPANVCDNHGYVRKEAGVCTCFCPPFIGGTTCNDVSTTCGGTYVLSTPGQSVTIQSENYPSNYNKEQCAYLFETTAGYHLELTVDEINLPTTCSHYLDIRRNAIGQPAAVLLCGSGTVPMQSTIDAINKDKMLVVFEGSSTAQVASGGYRFTVTVAQSPCLNDPCHGAPCVEDGASYRCIFPTEGIICGFEGDLVGTCGAVFSNIYYDNPNQYGRSWDIATSGSTSYGAVGPAEGQYYWNAGTEYTYTTPQYGTLSLAPTKVAGATWCLDFRYAVYGTSSGTLSVFKAVNGVLGTAIFSTGPTSTQQWMRQQLVIDGTGHANSDMIEVVFTSEHTLAYNSAGDMGLDDLRYTPGPCPTVGGPCDGNPCGNLECKELTSTTYECAMPSGDIVCGFELADVSCVALIDLYVAGDQQDMRINSGGTGSAGTGPSGAATGSYYAYFESSSPVLAGDKAWTKIKKLGGGNRVLEFDFHAYGADIGTVNLYRSVNGALPGTLITQVFTGDQENLWHHYSIELTNSATDPDEFIIEYVRGASFRGDFSIDNVQMTLVSSPPTTTTTSTTTTPTTTIPTTTTPTTTTPTTTTPTTTTPTTPTTTTPTTTTPTTTIPTTTTTPTTTIPTTTTTPTTTIPTTTTTPTTTIPTTTTTPTTTTPTTTIPTTTTTPTTTIPTTTTTSTTTTPTTTIPTTTTTGTTTTHGSVNEVCIGFEGGSLTPGMGSNDPDTGDYVIESANSPNSASGQVLITTGANWAAEGSYYLMYEADYGGATTGQSTKFRLPPIDAFYGSCLRLSYNMHGGDWAAGGEFRILAENSGVATTLSTISANTDDFWHLLELDIPAPSPFVLTNVIRGGVGSDHDLGIDAVSVSSGSCSSTAQTCGYHPALHSGDKLCGFEDGDDCTWLERDVPEAGTSTSWFTSEGATNGDARSRLDGAYLGTYYVRFNGRDYVENESGYLAIKPFEGTGARCLRFHLGKPARDTTFEVVTGDGTQLLSVTNDLGSTYSEYSLTIQSTPSTRVLFKGTRGKKINDLALDNIRYTAGAC